MVGIEKAIGILFLGTLCFMGYSKPCFGQNNDNIDSTSMEPAMWEDLLEELCNAEIPAESYGEMLSELHSNLIPLNGATKEMLESIPFLSEIQIENLAYYLYQYGPIQSLSEILLVDGMDEQTLRWLRPFVCIGSSQKVPLKISFKQLLQYGKQEFRTTTSFGLQKKEGYGGRSDSAKFYIGNPISSTLRYEFNYKSQVQFGLLIDKDPGEVFLNRKSKQFERLSFHIAIKGQKKLRDLIIGEYKMHFGQGLVCNNDFNLGKNAILNSPEWNGNTLKRHFSGSESSYFKGIASKIAIKEFQASNHKNSMGIYLTSFYSNKKIDSNLENSTFSTEYTDGLHRTGTEFLRKNNISQNVFGMHVQARLTNHQIGWSYIQSGYDAFKLSGSTKRQTFRNSSIDIRGQWKTVHYYGECAYDFMDAYAYLIGFTMYPFKRLIFNSLVRGYGVNYCSEFGNAFGENSNVQNEQGIYSSIECDALKNLWFKAYYDVYRFPDLRYQVSSPSSGIDFGMNVESTLKGIGVFSLKFNQKNSEKNCNDLDLPITKTETTTKNQIRIAYNGNSQRIKPKTIIEMNHFKNKNYHGFGWAFAQEIGWQPIEKMSFFLQLTFFQINNFSNRIYLYNRGIPGTFSMTMLNGEGVKQNIYVQYKSKKWAVRIKYENTALPSSKSIGNGLERINGDRTSKIALQGTWVI